MLSRVTLQNKADFLRACEIERVFGTKNRVALAAYGIDNANMSFWVGFASDGTPSAALYQAGGVLVVSSDNRIPPSEVSELVKTRAISEIDTNFEQAQALQALLGGSIESSYYMAHHGRPVEGDFSGITQNADLPKVFSVLLESHEYYRTHLEYERWAGDLSLKISLGLTEVVLLEENGVPVGTGSIISEDDQAGAISAVAVIPSRRGKGFGTCISQYLVNRILKKGKTPVLISGYDAVAELYRRVGFVETGRWGELYLEEELH